MIRFQVLPSVRLVVVQNRGRPTTEECRRLLAVLPERFPDIWQYDCLTDSREAESDLSYADMFAIRTELQSNATAAPGRRNALLVSRTATFGVARMFELTAQYEGGIDTRVVRTVAEAAAWLGHPESLLSQALAAGEWSAVE